jgi:hypothetical protein
MNSYNQHRFVFVRILDNAWCKSKLFSSDLKEIAKEAGSDYVFSEEFLGTYSLGVNNDCDSITKIPKILQSVLNRGHALRSILIGDGVYFPPYSHYSIRLHMLRYFDHLVYNMHTSLFDARELWNDIKDPKLWPYPEEAKSLLNSYKKKLNSVANVSLAPTQITVGKNGESLHSPKAAEHIHPLFNEERMLLKNKGDGDLFTTPAWSSLQNKIKETWPDKPLSKHLLESKYFVIGVTFLASQILQGGVSVS